MSGTLARVRAAADLLCRYPFACWHYGDSIGFEGLLAATDVLGDGRYEGFVHGACKAWIPRATSIPRNRQHRARDMRSACCCERTGDEAVLEACLELAAFLTGRRTLRGRLRRRLSARR